MLGWTRLCLRSPAFGTSTPPHPSNWSKKCPYFGQLGRFQNFCKMPYPYVEFDKKHDGDVAESVRPTILELFPNFVQKWRSKPRKMALSSILTTDTNLATSKTPLTAVSSKSYEFDKLVQKMSFIVRTFWPIRKVPKFSQKFRILM